MIDQAKVETGTPNVGLSKKNNNAYVVHNILAMFANYWYWILISIVLCGAGAWLKLKMSPNIFSIAATMQINSQNTQVNADVMKAFRTPSVAEKEIHFFTSRQVIEDVVRDLNLNVTYIVPHIFVDEDVYDKSPIDAYFVGNDYPNCNFNIKCRARDYTLTSIENEKGVKPLSWVGRYGDTIITPKGVLVVKKRSGSANVTNKELEIHYVSLEEATSRYMSAMSASIVDEDAGNIRLSMNDINLQRGIDAVNLWIETYNRHTVQYKNKVAENTARFIQERLEVISVELSDVEGNLEDYMRQNNISDINTETGSNISNRNQYSSALVEEEVSLNIARDLLNKIKDGKPNSMIPNINIGSSGISSMIESYNIKVQERQLLLENTSERSPLVRDADAQLAAMRSTIIRSLENFIESIRIRVREYRGQEMRTRSAINTMPTQRREMQSFTRQQSIKEQLYLYLLNKREENALKLTITDADTRVIDYANGGKISPNPKRTYTIALLIGLLVPIAVILIIRFMDVRVHTKKDVEDNCSIPVTGMIPEAEEESSRIISKSGKDRFNENYRILRNNMQFVGGHVDGGKVFMLTSARSGDGKSMMSYNVALSFAYAGSKVLLINGDIRKREGWHGSKEKYKVGLTTYLAGRENSNYEDIICDDAIHPELKVIHNGPIPPNPAELLMSKKMDDLVERARQEYDIIVIDSVPIDIVADAIIVNRLVDATFFVIREKTSDRRILPDLEDLYRTQKLKNLNIILNAFNYNHFSYGYGGYGYGYGYGYGENYGYEDREESGSES